MSLDTSNGPVSKLHYLIPASKPGVELCYNLLSSAANRFPVPTLLGYNGTGEFDAGASYLAKLRAIGRYLDQLDSKDDDDLVLIVDGYDVIMQLPPEVLIERYFELVNRSEAYMAKRFGLSIEDVRSRDMRQRLFWGPDMFCFPDDATAARCWAVPESNLLSEDPLSKNGKTHLNDVRYLNSGTAIGPIAEMRTLIAAALAEIEETYDTNYVLRNFDQYYVNNLFGRQEYYRSILATGREPTGGPDNRRIPEKRRDDQETEYHIAIDYKSALFQPRAGYNAFLSYLRFNKPGYHAYMTKDVLALGEDFVRRDIKMPSNVLFAVGRLYNSIPEAHPGLVASSWIGSVDFGVNLITNHIYAVWHCTGKKGPLYSEVVRMWWYRFARSLVKATVKAFQNGELITSQLVDGRNWAPKMVYPELESLHDELGGAWTDYDGGQFVEWEQLCGSYKEKLFGGEEGPLLIMASGDR